MEQPQAESDGELRREARDFASRAALGDMSAEDSRALADWRARSQRHDAAFRQASAQLSLIADGARRIRRDQQRRPSRRHILIGAAAAASAAVVFHGAGRLGWAPRLEGLVHDYATGVGEQRTAVLGPDISVDLDAVSAIDLLSDASARLASGAAVFSIANAQDWLIEAGPARLTASNAKFEAHHTSEALFVTCLAGEMDVLSGSSATLGPGDRVPCWSGGLGKVTQIPHGEIARWRDGVLVVRNRSAFDVAADLNRHRPGRIVLMDASAGERRIGGVFNLHRPESLVSQFAAIMGGSATELPGGIALIG
ncbi:MAG: FecR domain-containing protein [Pseudomonadota bacterium]